MAENKLAEKVAGGDTSSVFYTLNNHPVAKARGWSPRVQQEITGRDGGPVVVKGYATFSPDDWDDAKKEAG